MNKDRRTASYLGTLPLERHRSLQDTALVTARVSALGTAPVPCITTHYLSMKDFTAEPVCEKSVRSVRAVTSSGCVNSVSLTRPYREDFIH